MARALPPQKRYRLEFQDEYEAAETAIEFEAPSVEAALFVAQKHCVNRPAQLYEGERYLGSISLSGVGGHWNISGRTRPMRPPQPEAAQDRMDQIPPM